MKNLLIILFALLALSSIAQTNPNAILDELKFEKVELGYDEGLRKVVDIYILEQDADGIIWIGSTDGIYRFNGISALNVTEAINNRQANLIASQWVTAIVIDEDYNRIYVGTTIGAYVIDKSSMKCERLKYDDGKTDPIEGSSIRNIIISNDILYICTRDGAFALERNSLNYKNSYLSGGQKLRNKRGTSSNCSFIIEQDTSDYIYFSSKLGLIKINKSSGKQDTFRYGPLSDPYNYFSDLKNLGNHFVISDYKYGVVLFDRTSEKFIRKKTILNEKDWYRFKSKVYIGDSLYLVNVERKGIGIYDVVQDKYVWSDREFDIKQGLYNLMKDKNGYIWFATRGEIYKSNISFNVEKSKQFSKIDISHIFANGNKIWSATDSIGILNLEEHEHNIEFNFALTPGIGDTSDVYYAVNNQKYVKAEEGNIIALFNLNPGQSIIKIKASNNENQTIDEKTLSININQPFYKTWWFYTLIIGFVSGVIYFVYRYNKHQYIQKERIKAEYEQKLAQLENQALRSQINPHFIFNTLNSIKYYSIQKTPEETSDFISTFSILIRRILENSKKSLITLEEEISTLKNYTEIEGLRFHEGFVCEFYVDERIPTQEFLVPPMIIQPFVENAIWHGLMHKASDRKLTIKVLRRGEGIECQVVDNGVGREASKKMRKKQSHKSSLGMQITQDRMDLINEKNQMDNSIEIIDLVDDNNGSRGTQVNIYFKFNN